MSQKNVQNDTCPKCKNGWLTHHTLKGVTLAGVVEISCYPTPVATMDTVLKYVLETRAAKLAALAELQASKEEFVSYRQASEAELKREYEAKVEAEADRKAEQTRVALVSTHEALVRDLKAQLKEAEGVAELLAEEKRNLAETTAEEKRLLNDMLSKSDRKSIDLQMQVVELEARLTLLQSRHKGLKEKSLDIVKTLISMGTRVAVLEEKTGVIPKVDPERIYAIVMGQEYEDVGIPVTELRNDPTPVPLTAPKAVVATAAAPKAASAPSAPTDTVTLDDGDHDVDDDHIVEQQDATPDADDEESPGDEHAECSFCKEHATEELIFFKKDGSEGRLNACDPSKHADAFLKYLVAEAKGAPKTPADVIMLFNPITE